jgi:archaemetzincin
VTARDPAHRRGPPAREDPLDLLNGQPPRAGEDVLRLVPIFFGSRASLLPRLSKRLTRTFGMRVEQHPPGFDPEVAYDASRGQHSSRILLAQLLQDQPPGAGRILGVTDVDLFIPVLTFVFGEAQLDGPAAVVSTHRLDSERYGLPRDPELLFERLVKEATHELGHTFHLLHCTADRCVMGASRNVDEVDLKSERFCPRCSEAVREARVPVSAGS